MENSFYRFEGIHQTTYLVKFHENSKFPGAVDSIFESAKFLPLKLSQPPRPPVRSYFHETLQEGSTGKYFQICRRVFDTYCQSKDMADFLNIQGELEPLALSLIDSLHLTSLAAMLVYI